MVNPRLLEQAKRLMNDKIPEPRPKKSEPEVPTPRSTSTKGINLSDYIFLKKHNLYVAKQKSHFDKDWYQAHEDLHKQKAKMLIIKEFVDFLEILRTGNANDGLGNKVQKAELELIYNEITEKKDPWRTEWLDADFKVINGVLHINYNHRTVNGQLKPQDSEPLEKCLMKDRTPGIGLNDWLKNATSQGLPKKNVKKGSLYYWYPRSDNNSVARFFAYSGGAGLSCCRGPRGSNSALGVHVVYENF